MPKESISNTAFFDQLKKDALTPIRRKEVFNNFASESKKVFDRCQNFNLKDSHYYYTTEGDYKLFMARIGVRSDARYHLYLSNKEKMIGRYYFAAILESSKVTTILPNWKKDAATAEEIENIQKCLTILKRNTPLCYGKFGK
jgi:hypothetical protein